MTYESFFFFFFFISKRQIYSNKYKYKTATVHRQCTRAVRIIWKSINPKTLAYQRKNDSLRLPDIKSVKKDHLHIWRQAFCPLNIILLHSLQIIHFRRNGMAPQTSAIQCQPNPPFQHSNKAKIYPFIYPMKRINFFLWM